jgi:muconolactone delta-isomerase
MKILALNVDVPGVTYEQMAPHMKAETKIVWDMYMSGALREIYLRQDQRGVVIIFECDSVEEVQQHLNTLPLVQHGLIAFDVVPVGPYPGFARLFA